LTGKNSEQFLGQGGGKRREKKGGAISTRGVGGQNGWGGKMILEIWGKQQFQKKKDRKGQELLIKSPKKKRGKAKKQPQKEKSQ